MDDSGDPKMTSAAAAANVQRQEFNSAYDNLEQMIRNFGKEKMVYEQKIEGLRNQLGMAQESVQKMAMSNQEVMAYNKELVKIREEDEITRASLENKLFAVEHKQDIIFSTIDGLEKLEQDMNRRYDEHEEFIYCLKFRQLQLKDWIDETAHLNRQLDLELSKEQEKFNNLQQEYSQAKDKHSKETKAFEKQIEELGKTIQQLSAQLEEEKVAHSAALEKFNVTSAKLNQYLETKKKENEALKLDIEKLKEEAELQKKLSAEEKASLEKDLELAALKQEEDKARLEAQIEVWKKRAQELDETLAVERSSFQSIVQGLQESGAELKSKLEAKEKDMESLRESYETKIEEINVNGRMAMDQLMDKAVTEKSELEGALEQLRSKYAGEKADFENKISEQEKAIQNLETCLEAEKAAHSKALEEFTVVKDQLNEDLTTKKEEAEALKADIEKLKLEVEQQKRLFAEDKIKLQNDLQAATSKYAEEKAALDQQIEELSKKIQDHVERLQKEESLHQAAIKEFNDLEAKLRMELAAHEDSIKMLNEKLQDSKVEMEKQASAFSEEKKGMQSAFESEINRLEEKRLEREKNHAAAMAAIEKLKKELDRTQKEKRELLKRYQDQKQAISKMVEEVGVRPVILPSAKNSSRMRIPVTPTSSQDASRNETIPQIQRTPISRPLPDPTTPTRTGILKRHSFSVADKNGKQVSFGPSITDFVISSDTDSSPSQANNDAKKEAPAPIKRMRFDEDKKKLSQSELREEDSMEKEKENEDSEKGREIEKPVRRYFKRGTSQNKK